MSIKIKEKHHSISEVLVSFQLNNEPKNKELKFSHPSNFNTSEITHRAVEILVKDYSENDSIIITEIRLRLTIF